MAKAKLIRLSGYTELSTEKVKIRAEEFYEKMSSRRSIRQFSDKPVPFEIIKNCLLAAGTAPSGANMQPWQFVLVGDAKVKKEIRIAAEKEEHEFYSHRAPQDWLDALAPLGTGEKKEFLEIAPFLIVVFEKKYGVNENGDKIKYYYTGESVGIATGMLITAIHNAGLASLTHTPSPMKFLNKILNRPLNEKPFLILVVGYPAKEAVVPVRSKKEFSEFVTVI